MLAICSGSRYIVVLGLVIQYLSGEGTFPGRQSPRVIISYSNAGAVCGHLGRMTAAHRSHVNTPHSWRIPDSRQRLIVLLCIIHRSFHLSQRGCEGGR